MVQTCFYTFMPGGQDSRCHGVMGLGGTVTVGPAGPAESGGPRPAAAEMQRGAFSLSISNLNV